MSAEQIEKYISGLPAGNKEIVQALHKLVMATIPKCNPLIGHGMPGYSLTESGYDRIIYIWPSKKHVSLGFFFGGYLNDQEKLLIGTGARMRHVVIKSLEDVSNPALKDLIREAWEIAPELIEKIHAKKKV